jgi:hypothetical protein
MEEWNFEPYQIKMGSIAKSMVVTWVSGHLSGGID